MASIGQTLKQQREKLGISLTDVYSATRITPQNLQALEEDRFDAFPNKVYTRAFLRDYANFLGLDGSLLLEDYEALSSPRRQETPPPAGSKQADGASTLVRSVAIFIILVVVGLAAYRPIVKFVTTVNELGDDASPARPPVAQPTPAPKPPAPTPPPPVAVNGVDFVVDTLGASWVRVTVDGKKPFEGVLPAARQFKWHGQKKVLFRTGNAGGVRLTVNGKKLAPLGGTGQIVQRAFAAPPPQTPPVAPTAPTQ